MEINSNGPTPAKYHLDDGIMVEWDLREYSQIAREYIASNLSKNHLHWDEDKKYLQIKDGFIKYTRKISHKHVFGLDTGKDIDLIKCILSAEELYYPQAEKIIEESEFAVARENFDRIPAGRLLDKVAFYGSLMIDERIPEEYISKHINGNPFIWSTDDGWGYLDKIHYGMLCLLSSHIGPELFASRYGFMAARDVFPLLELPDQIARYLNENYRPRYTVGEADMHRVLFQQQVQSNRLKARAAVSEALRQAKGEQYATQLTRLASLGANYNEKYRVLRTRMFRIFRQICEHTGLDPYTASVETIEKRINSPV